MIPVCDEILAVAAHTGMLANNFPVLKRKVKFEGNGQKVLSFDVKGYYMRHDYR